MRPRLLPTLLVTGVLVALAWGGLTLASGGDETDRAIEGARVRRGPLSITVLERGNLKAADSVTLRNDVEGRTTILWLIEEGTQVEPGDLVCELDTSELVDRRVQQEIRVQDAEAARVKAEQNHAIQVSQNESDIANAEQDLEFAELELEKYLEGDLPQQLQSLDEDILLADEELTRANQDLIWSERLAEKGFLEQAQLDADRLAKTRAEVTLAQSRRAKELYESYEVPKRKKELTAAVAEKKRELERVVLQAKARLADYDADLRKTKATLDVERAELDKILSQIEKSRLHAPVAGMIVYARDRGSRWGDDEPMQEGTEVRERQDIVTIPSSDGYVAETSLHESVLEKVEVGMDCRVTVDALGETFPGEVTFKAVLPDQQSWFANPDLRVYRSEVRLLARDPRLRPGMSCSIEILVEEIEDTLSIPVQAVFLDAGEPVCFVSEDGQVERRPVAVGPNNGKWVAIESGLFEGERVLLAPPPGIELRPSEEDEEDEEPRRGRPGPRDDRRPGRDGDGGRRGGPGESAAGFEDEAPDGGTGGPARAGARPARSGGDPSGTGQR